MDVWPRQPLSGTHKRRTRDGGPDTLGGTQQCMRRLMGHKATVTAKLRVRWQTLKEELCSIMSELD